MASLMIVCGPQAVGKMTVAEKIKEKTDFSLTTNHDSIELSDKIFEKGSQAQRELRNLIREATFKTAIDNNVNIIFTYVWAFDEKSDWDYVLGLKEQFEKSGGKFYLVELETDLQTRLERNTTPHRLESKPSKKDIEWSKNDILKTNEKYRLNSNEGEITFENFVKIDNTNLSPEEVANIVVDKFELKLTNC